MARLFGTDGVRGKANVYPMSADSVLSLGQAIGHHFKKEFSHPRILIGKDTRRSGYMLEQALSAGIASVGVDTGLLGPLPTPGIAYLTRGMRACAGIVISASHNPFDDNGIKIFSADGYKLPDSVEDELETLAREGMAGYEHPTGMDIGKSTRIDDAVGQYAVFLKEQFPKHLTLEGVRIVLDCANGAAYKVAPKVFEELGAELFLTGVEPNGKNINAECGALYPERLMDQVHRYKADVGLALDGDADRLIVVDNKGELVNGDQLMAICGHYFKKRGTLNGDRVVATIMSNMGLDISLAEIGVEVIRTKVGDRYVVEKMRQGKYNLGGEQSGHLVFMDCSTTGDGILAALHLLEIMLESSRSVSELKKVMDLLPQVLKNLDVERKIPLQELPQLGKQIDSASKKLGKKGRVLFRYSGTENKARIMVEGENSTEIEQIAAELIQETERSITGAVRGT